MHKRLQFIPAVDYHQSAIFRRNIKMLKHIFYIIYQNKFAFHRRVGKVVGSIVQHRNVMMQDKKNTTV